MRHSRSIYFLAAILAAALPANRALRADDSPANAAIHRALQKQVALKYTAEPLEQVAKGLQTKLGIPILLDSKALIDVGIARDTPVTFSIANVSARAAISLMLRPLQLTATVQRESLVITTPEEAENMLETRVYDVADLVTTGAHGEGPHDFQPLVNAIKTCVGFVTWDDVGGSGSLVAFDTGGINAIVVSQTERMHEELADLLADLRAVRDRKVRAGKVSVSPGGASPAGAAIDLRLPQVTEAEAAVRRALAKPITFDFIKTPLSKIIATLRQKAGLPIVFDLRAMEDGLPRPRASSSRKRSGNETTPSLLDWPLTAQAANIPLGLALDDMLRPYGFAWTYNDECLLVTIPQREEELQVTRCYDVSDLPAFRDSKGKGVPDFDAIIDMITSTVSPAMWDTRSPGQIAVIDQPHLQVISVSQTWKVHRQIEQLLTGLRQHRRSLPTPERIAKLPPLPARQKASPARLSSSVSHAERPFLPPPQPDPMRDAIVNANNRIAFDLYKQMVRKDRARRRENLVFSPASITTVMAMVYAGARGQTAEEMAKTLHLNMPPADVAPACRSLLATLPLANHPGCRLTLANSFWGRQGYQFTAGYLETLRKSFAADLTSVDFARSGDVCQAINGWVSKKTEGKIPQIIGPELIQRNLGFVGISAVHFQGQWWESFPGSETKAAWFYGEEPIETPLMHQVTTCRYGLADNLQILEKTYRGGELAMMILLSEGEPPVITDIEQILSAEKVKQWSSMLKPRTVEVYLPQFELETGLDLAQTLAAMGMPRLFQPAEADLSGMHSDKTPLWLSRVLHRASLRVNEEGTVAAAAMAGMGTFGGPPIPMAAVFRADHPFVFLIRDTRTNNILFLGRLVQPKRAPERMPKEHLPGGRGGMGMGVL